MESVLARMSRGLFCDFHAVVGSIQAWPRLTVAPIDPHLALAFHPQPGKLASHRSDAEQPDAPGRGLTHGDHHEREFAHHPPLPARRPGRAVAGGVRPGPDQAGGRLPADRRPLPDRHRRRQHGCRPEDAGYQVDWRQFTSGGDISTALASGKVPVGVLLDRHHRRRHARRGPAAVLGAGQHRQVRGAGGAQRLGHRKHRRPEGASASPRRSCRPRTSICWSGWNRYGRFRRATCAS